MLRSLLDRVSCSGLTTRESLFYCFFGLAFVFILLAPTSDVAASKTPSTLTGGVQAAAKLAQSRQFESSSSDRSGRYAKDLFVLIDGSAKPMPRVGFGTCCSKSAKGSPLIQSAKKYLASGGRLIDTGMSYGNTKEIAVAIRESKVPRGEIWITSKLNTAKHKAITPNSGIIAVAASMISVAGGENENTGIIDYYDLLLLDGAWKNTATQRLAQWRALIAAKKEGVVRNIGVANYNQEQIEELEQSTGVIPAVNQIEYHPWIGQEARQLALWCKSKGIIVIAYGSFGGSVNSMANIGNAVQTVAQKHNVKKSQVLLQWALDQDGVTVIPGATSELHIRENLDFETFRLDAADLKLIESSSKPAGFKRWGNLPCAKESCGPQKCGKHCGLGAEH